MLIFELVTIFPGLFDSLFSAGIVKRAQERGLVTIRVHDLRAAALDRHRTVDDRPFGGGEGMVLKPEPLAATLDALSLEPRAERRRESVVMLSAQGRRFTQADARALSGLDRVVLISGRYEGVDERILELYCDRELSIGDYVLSGGELAAAVVLDATMRLLPGVLGNQASAEFESFGSEDAKIAAGADGVPRSQHGAGGLLDYPHYTRPREFRGLRVPEVLESGDHAEIRRWRRRQQLLKTARNRPDLLAGAALSEEERELLAGLDLPLPGSGSAG